MCREIVETYNMSGPLEHSHLEEPLYDARDIDGQIPHDDLRQLDAMQVNYFESRSWRKFSDGKIWMWLRSVYYHFARVGNSFENLPGGLLFEVQTLILISCFVGYMYVHVRIEKKKIMIYCIYEEYWWPTIKQYLYILDIVTGIINIFIEIQKETSWSACMVMR